MRIETCRFEVSAFAAKDEPRAPGPHVAFLGRSNVGKSSWINRLLGKPGLARTSSTPGRTQSVNFYRVNDAVWFVDLPGSGYAKVPVKVRRAWGPMVEGSLERHREHLAIGILLVDARHEPTEMDGMMKTWLHDRGIPHLLVATKADKLSGNERSKSAGPCGRHVEPPIVTIGDDLPSVRQFQSGPDALFTAADVVAMLSKPLGVS